ncbi:helix-turn-helix domain-containing protein [Umezawaea sp. Da 62-37]|uniref:helix-turn-helix domain-containing protein n=1 Tax=Umezawaea sp. Da 62-37 TaxID=3075927 RepID=UPI0028F704B0|nr:helix-turn-helix domain-containing protein [Umezawaea sp. Da 62-37]WNV83828.1 helix-turn-helix domain-containing protein [Umezawaea sp. Da 62-37]
MKEREVKLGRTLSSLIERGGYSGNRRDILTALDISPAALSQYARDQTRPSFQKLVALADFFGVSLDYLVFGEVGVPEVGQGVSTGYIESTWQQVAANTRRHSALVGRMGRVLADRVDEVARELANSPTAGREGLIQDDEAARIERFCLSVDILTLNLDYDMVLLPDGSAAAGRFMDVVATNLLAGCDYRFLVPVGAEHVIEQFRILLTERVGRDLVSRNCSFRRTAQPVYSGIAIYRLNMDKLAAEDPALLAQMQDYIGVQGELGYTIRPNEDLNNDMMMSREHRDRAKAAFNALWTSGRLE